MIYSVVLVSGISHFYYVSENELGAKNTKMNKTVCAHLERMRSILIYNMCVCVCVYPDIEVHVSALRIWRGQVPKRGMGRGRGCGKMFECLIWF